MAFIPGMQTAVTQAATMVEESGKPTFAQKAELASMVAGQVTGVMKSMREKKRNLRMEEERNRRQQEAMQIEGAGTDVDMLAANMPGNNPYAERPIS